MSEWREVTLDDFSKRVTVGHVGKMANEYVPEGVPFLRSQNVKPFAIQTDGMLRISEGFHDRLAKSTLRSGDVVVVRTGYPGAAAVVPHDLDNSNCADLVVITPNENLNPYVLAAVFNSAWGRATVGGHLVGAAQQHFNVGSAKALRFRLPSKPVQEQIAGILCALGDLIENNRRRIKLLEQMAQAIYREWFVHFRCPGHEHATFVDSAIGPIPEGWSSTTIGDVLELRYGKALKAADRNGGMVAVVGSSAVVGWHDVELVPGPAIIVGRKGNVGNVIWVDAPSWPIDTTYYVTTDLPLRFVVEQLRRADFIDSHAAVPGLSRGQACALPFLLPDRNTMVAYDSVSLRLGQSGRALAEQADRLSELRDLLLPKLVSGQIDVSKLDLDTILESAG